MNEIDVIWQAFCKQDLTNYDLCWVIRYNTSEEYKSRAWEQLLKQNPTIDDLCWIIRYDISGEYRSRAWEQLLKQNPTINDLDVLANYMPEEYGSKVKALRSLLESVAGKSKSELLEMMIKKT